MAEQATKPDPQGFPIGSKVKVFPVAALPVGGKREGQPPGAEVGEYTVGNDGTLTVTGIEAAQKYVAWRQAGGVDYYLEFQISTFSTGGGAVSSVAGRTGDVTLTVADVEGAGTGAVSSVNEKTGDVVLKVADISGAAPLASPTFTGVPAAPTAAEGTNTTQLATTAHVKASTAAEAKAREEADALKAPLASPTFTGVPAAPTAAGGTNTTQVATTAFTKTAVAGEATAREEADALKAPLASPTFTGTPAAPTAAEGTNTTQLASTAYVTAAVAALKKKLRIPHAWVWRRGEAVAVETVDGPAISLVAGQTVKLVRVSARLDAGTKVTCKLQVNGEDATGFTAIEVKTGETKVVEPTAVSLADKDIITLLVTAIEGSPKGLVVRMQLEHAV